MYEQTNFKGKHYVECYIIQNSICIVMNRMG
ncbi:nucleotide-binding domain-containing protein [Turicibacter sanguinis]